MTTTVETLANMINLYKGMDWYSMMSDDGRVVAHGRKQKDALRSLLTELGIPADTVFEQSMSLRGREAAKKANQYREGKIEQWKTCLEIANQAYATNVSFDADGTMTLSGDAQGEEMDTDENVLTTADGEIKLDELPEVWRSRVGAVEALRLACGATAWPTKVYRALRVFASEGKRIVVFSRDGMGMMTPRVRKNFLVNVASAMQAKNCRTSVCGATKVYVFSKKKN